MKKHKLTLRDLITEGQISDVGDYVLIDGGIVKFGSLSCIEDLSARIADMSRLRDECDARTDARVHYNGVLNVFRRTLNMATKVNSIDVNGERELIDNGQIVDNKL